MFVRQPGRSATGTGKPKYGGNTKQKVTDMAGFKSDSALLGKKTWAHIATAKMADRLD